MDVASGKYLAVAPILARWSQEEREGGCYERDDVQQPSDCLALLSIIFI